MPAAGNRPGPLVTTTRRRVVAMFLVCAGATLVGCPGRKPPIVQYSEQESARGAIEQFRNWTLDPARLPPPSVQVGPLRNQGEGLSGTAMLLRPEDAGWNQWGPDALPLLFNNRVALLFELQVPIEGEVRWIPEASWLEVNTPDARVPAVPSAEHLLADLSWHALQQERWLLEGDLVQRTRNAGGFREAFVQDGEGLSGVVAFALPDPDVHIGALRLTVMVQVDGAPHELVWVFQ